MGVWIMYTKTSTAIHSLFKVCHELFLLTACVTECVTDVFVCSVVSVDDSHFCIKKQNLDLI